MPTAATLAAQIQEVLALAIAPTILIVGTTDDGGIVFIFIGVGSTPDVLAQALLNMPAATLQTALGASSVAFRGTSGGKPGSSTFAPSSPSSSPPPTAAHTTDATNAGLIIGLAIAGGVALLLVIVIIVRRKAIWYGSPDMSASERELTSRRAYEEFRDAVNS
jgi:hypothetical protein